MSFRGVSTKWAWGIALLLAMIQGAMAATYSVTDAGSGAGCTNAWPPSIVGNYSENGTVNGYPRYDNPGGPWYIYRTTIYSSQYWVVSNTVGSSDLNDSTIGFYLLSSASTPPTGSSYTNTNSACGRISVASGGGASAPSAPTIYNLNSGTAPYISGGSTTVYWSAVSGVTGYKLDVATDSGFTSLLSGYNPKVVNNTPTPDTYTTVSGLASPGTTYYFRVRAYNSVGDSSNSATLSTTTIPSTPTATSASAITGTTFQANWNAQSGASSYKLYVATDSGFTSYVSGYNPGGVSGTSESLSGLSPATTYYYRLKASSENGDSSVSNTISLTTNALPALSGTFTTAGAVNDNATTTPFAGVTVSDANANNVSLSITYTAANGTLSGTGLSGSAGSYTLASAAPATLTTNLRGLVFTPTLHQGAPGTTVTTVFTLTPNDGIDNGTANSSTSLTTTMVNAAPSFVGSTTTLNVNANSSATDIKSLLHAADSDSGQTLTWSQSSAPSNGTLSIASATASSGGSDITPGGTITYAPTSGYSGSDSFAVQVSDGWASVARTISVTIAAVVPGAPTAVSATMGDAQAVVSFTAPSNTGGSAISGYSASCTSSDGGASGSQSGSASPLTVTGLTNGKSYTCTVTASNSAGSGSASTASSSFTPKANQTITFANPGAQNFGTTPTLTASASPSGLTVAFTSASTSVCTITSGGALSFVSAGTCTINADQAGSATYNAATQVPQSFTVNAVVPGAPSGVTVTAGDGQASVAFSAPASTGGVSLGAYAATCTSSDGGATGSASGAASPLSVSGLTNGKSYTCTVTASNSVGSGSASAASSAFTPKANQTITFANPGAQTFGTTPTLSATASPSSLAVSFSSTTSSVCTITSGGALTLVSAGSCSIQATQAGDAVYNAATPVTQTFTVNPIVPGAPTIGTATSGDGQLSVAFSAPASNGGAAISSYGATCTSSDGGATGTASGLTSPITVGSLTNGKTYTCSVTATNSAGSGAASGASNSVVPRATQTISFANPGNKNFGTNPTLSATASPSGLAVTFTSSTTPVCTVTSDGTLTFVTTGLCTIAADQAGNATYNAAVTVSQSFTVVAVVPGAPTGVAASAGENQATVTFTAPTFTGGAAISSYTATCSSSDGGVSGNNSGTSPIVVSGLTNAKTYTCTVTATNSAGVGAASGASNAVTPNPSPKVTSVAVPASGRYKAGSQLDFTLTWDSNVSVAGTPRLSITVGAVTVQADYASSPGSNTMQFRYTVQAGHNAPSGVVVTALALNGGTIRDATTAIDATLTLNGVASGAGVVVDTTAPTLPAANIVVNNQGDPHKVVVSFDEALDSTSLGAATAWSVTANGGSPAYAVASLALSGGNAVTLSLAAVNMDDATTYIVNDAIAAHLKVTPPTTLKDVAGNAYAGGTITESGATPVRDTTAPILSGLGTSAAMTDGGTLAATSNEKAKGYWVAVAKGAAAPTPAQVRAAVAYGSPLVSLVSHGSGALPGGTAGSLKLSGLAASTEYDIHLMGEDAAGNPSAAIESTTLTTAALVVAPPGAGTVTLSNSGSTAAPTGGQTIIITENAASSSTIVLPPPTSLINGTPTANTIQVNLPNSTGTVGVTSNSEGTKLGVQTTTLPGSNTPVTTVTVDQGSASFTASKSGQAVAGLKNGIVVVAGEESSKVTVDASGTAAKITVTASDTIVVPSGSANVSGTVLALPPPGAGGEAVPVTIKAGEQTVTVQAGQADTRMTFQVIDIDGVKTPVLAVTGTAQVGASGSNQPLVSVGGNVIRTGSGQSCDTAIQASGGSGSDTVQVLTCYIVLAPGSFSSARGNGFAALKDGIIWAGETAEFDAGGVVTGAYLGTREGNSAAVGDDLVPGGNKFAAAGYASNAFVPRLAGKPARLQGASLDQAIFTTFNQILGTSSVPPSPAQGAQGILVFRVNGDAAAAERARAILTFELSDDQVTVFPSRRVRVDTSRADGIAVSSEGNVEVATGGLVTTFVPTVADPQAFAADLAAALPGVRSEMRWNGSWQIFTADGQLFVGRPQWGVHLGAGANGFAVLPDGTISHTANGASQVVVADFHDYTTLQNTFMAELNDSTLLIRPRMNGTVQAKVAGNTYLLTPQWSLIPAARVADRPAWWLENGVLYVKNADGTAQGFTVR